MSALVVVNFLSLDGVMQSVLENDDRDGGFERGGWVVPYIDPVVAQFMQDSTVGAAGMLLGRRTYETFTATWSTADQNEPAIAAMNRMPKYVASRTLSSGAWENTTVLGPDLPAEVHRLTSGADGEIVVFGSGELIQSLLAEDLIDEFRLLIFPLVLGPGKRMFRAGGPPAQLRLLDASTSGSGVMIVRYGRERLD